MIRLGRAVCCFIIVMVLILAACVPAIASMATVVGSQADSNSVTLFISGEQNENLSARMSQWECKISSEESLDQLDVGARTLFLIDISTSMRKGSQEQVLNLLIDMIESKGPKDQYAIAAFGEKYELLVDFTTERYDIAKAVEKLKWDQQQSSIYHAVQSAAKTIQSSRPEKACFSQLIVFSDGVEKSESGIIKEELFLTLKEILLPVHTVGFQYEGNADTLKDLYAFSRITGGESFEVSVESDPMEIGGSISEYTANIRCVQVTLPEQAKDGSVRPLELLDSSGAVILSYNVHMPRVEQTPVSSQPEPVVAPVVKPEPEAEASSLSTKWLIIYIALGVVVLAAIVAAVILLLRKKRKKGNVEVVEEQSEGNETEFWSADENHTMLLIPDQQAGAARKYLLVLNDLNNPHMRFESMVESTVEIGREPSLPGITIDYDKRVSKRHCAVTRREDGLWVEDLGSTNKTFVNDELVRTPRMLKDNDVLSCGKARFSVRIEQR